jgi:hypothetical protein
MNNKKTLFWGILLLGYGICFVFFSILFPETNVFKGGHFDVWQGVVAGIACIIGGFITIFRYYKKKFTLFRHNRPSLPLRTVKQTVRDKKP